MDQPSHIDRQAAVTITKTAFLEALTAYFAATATEDDSILLQLLALPCCAHGAQLDAALVVLATELTALSDAPWRTDVLGQIDQQRQRVLALVRG